jgi:hypothetical protein
MDKTESYIKHKKYYTSYKPNDTFWGIGIENETYIEIPNDDKVDGSFFFKNNKRERYSVDYYDTYLNDYFLRSIKSIYKEKIDYKLPLLLNAHGFLKCDENGEHQTTYEKKPIPNPNFNGKTVFETMKERDPYFSTEYENSFCFDGDTLEFMTLNFYKTSIDKVIHELISEKKKFIHHFNKLNLNICNNKNADYPKKNHGFARFTTNKNNLAIFNNGTYHFNFTLPTELDNNGNIKNMKKFISDHRRAARYIQFFEPFFVAIYGSPDPLSESPIFKFRFPKGSQRVAASRYISVGTYNLDSMISGKLLQQNRQTFISKVPPYFWYTKLYEQIHYKMNDKIGYDINFNKFKNHGLELRFFEWFDESLLHEVLTAIVYILDYSQDTFSAFSPIYSKVWNNLMYRAIMFGKNTILNVDEFIYIRNVLKLDISSKSFKIEDVFKEIISTLKEKYKYEGKCSKYMLEKPFFENEIKTVNFSNCFCFPWLSRDSRDSKDSIPKPKEQLK